MFPIVQIRRQKRADFIKAEARLLRGRDEMQHQNRLFRIGPIAVRSAIDCLQQADAFIKTDARSGKATALCKLADFHIDPPFRNCLTLNLT
ncbi:Mercuric resistance operon regulatory [Brucella melitensis NI]|nr:Mercuric resistance operon regulatory [Brucella melitensis NI]